MLLPLRLAPTGEDAADFTSFASAELAMAAAAAAAEAGPFTGFALAVSGAYITRARSVGLKEAGGGDAEGDGTEMLDTVMPGDAACDGIGSDGMIDCSF